MLAEGQGAVNFEASGFSESLIAVSVAVANACVAITNFQFAASRCAVHSAE
jgi:hypothetical protein